MVAEGSFVLYSRIEPALKAGDYRFETRQNLQATKAGTPLGPSQLPVEPLDTHVRVRAPQYQLPPDQVLSTFPPAGREGSFGSRLPQIVIKRRTLPWERSVGAGHESEPWLALVVIAEGEAQLKQNQPVAQCVTNGVHLDTPADVENGNYLEIRKSALERIFPTRDEVALLAHAREVDIHDTELMMGDDDGFLSVVIANRLPLPGRDDAGNEVPVKYLACLVNLCGQFDRLLEHAPPPAVRTFQPIVTATAAFTMAEADKLSMGTSPTTFVYPHGLDDAAGPKAASAGTRIDAAHVVTSAAAPYDARDGWATADGGRSAARVYEDLARGFDRVISVKGEDLEPTYRFPVLIHWSFTSTGNQTFETLMVGLSSGLLGTQPADDTPKGRPPLEVVETGHVGLAHRTRRGDQVRTWYRSPLVPHPTTDPATGDRLALAHAADQLRVVVPDGREDLSLAAAFEIGRLLGLSRPAMVAALMRWRQRHYQAAQRAGVFAGAGVLADALAALRVPVNAMVGGAAGARIAAALRARPSEMLGNPRPLVDPGRAVLPDADVNKVLATGFALDAKLLEESPDVMLARLRTTTPRMPRGGFDAEPPIVREQLASELDRTFTRSAVQALGADELQRLAHGDRATLAGVPLDLLGPLAEAPVPHGGDALDKLLLAQPALEVEEDDR